MTYRDDRIELIQYALDNTKIRDFIYMYNVKFDSTAHKNQTNWTYKAYFMILVHKFDIIIDLMKIIIFC